MGILARIAQAGQPCTDEAEYLPLPEITNSVNGIFCELIASHFLEKPVLLISSWLMTPPFPCSNNELCVLGEDAAIRVNRCP